MASRQKTVLAVFDTAMKYSALDIRKEKLYLLKTECINIMGSLAAKINSFKQVYSEFVSCGIRAVVVKGPICSALYIAAQMREYSDFDILVSENDFQKASEILNKFGFSSDSDCENFEVGFYNKIGCRIEVHKSLFDPEDRLYNEFNKQLKIDFDDLCEKKFEDIEIITPHPQENFLYLAFHLYKHFVFSGCGIRQIADICLFASHHKDLDWKRIFDILTDCGIETFINAVLLIGNKYFGLDLYSIHSSATGFIMSLDINPILTDIMYTGLYGGNDPKFNHSSTIVKSGKNKLAGIFKSLFPTFNYMKKHYPILKNKPILLPIFYLKRIKDFLFSGKSWREVLKTGEERAKTVKKYGGKHEK